MPRVFAAFSRLSLVHVSSACQARIRSASMKLLIAEIRFRLKSLGQTNRQLLNCLDLIASLLLLCYYVIGIWWEYDYGNMFNIQKLGPCILVVFVWQGLALITCKHLQYSGSRRHWGISVENEVSGGGKVQSKWCNIDWVDSPISVSFLFCTTANFSEHYWPTFLFKIQIKLQAGKGS